MRDLIRREDVFRIIDDRFSRTMIGDILKQDINALPEAEAIYVCDRKKCEDCNPSCDFTRDINHAGTIDKVLIIDRKKEDIKLAPKGRQCRIDRCELFNRLATITAEDANEMKAKIYAVIQEMPAIPEKVLQPVHVHIDKEKTEEILEKIREEYELMDDIVRCKECKCFNHFEDKEHGEWNTCERHMIFMNPDDFCSYGEREGE